VAIRPLCVEELAELLAYDFDTTEEGIPIVNPNWRWEDHEEAVLSTCSSLIAVVSDGDSRVVQFSHFSVKEFLTSNRLASSGGDVTHHCISLEFASVSPLNSPILSSRKLVLVLYYLWTIRRVDLGQWAVAVVTFLWLDMPLNIGWHMLGLTRFRRESRLGCNNSLTQQNLNFLPGSSCTMWTSNSGSHPST
jgi:hypothetical protein